MFATPADVAAFTGETFTVEQSAAVQVKIDQLESLIRLRDPGIEAAANASADLMTLLRGLIAGAVARHLRNPDGKLSESIDDYSFRRSDENADGALFLSESEWAQLVRSPSSSPTAAFTVPVGPVACRYPRGVHW